MLKQTSRQVRLYTALEDDRLVFRSMRMTAALGRLYEMELEFYSDDGAIPYDQVLGHMVSVTLDRSHGEMACFTGLLSRFGFAGSHGRRFVYRATAVPWLWMLTQTEDCRIFHSKTAPEIVREVFEQNGYRDFEFRLQKDYPTYEYCVQYRESDFNFVSRLLEREGIYYYFTHEVGQHKLILTDAMSAHEPMSGDETFEYFARDDYSIRRRECVFSWHPEERVQPGRVSLRDYNFKQPGADMTGEAAIRRQHGGSGMEIYDYPGLYPQLGAGQGYAKTRIEERQTEQATVRAESNLRGVAVGASFDLTMHPVSEYNTEYLVTAAEHELYADDYESGGEESETYRCRFSALKRSEVFRPARTTRKPLIAGPQTATVVGEDEIDCDEYGRIIVLFHWDREEAISMRCRVSQNWSGNTWGGMVIPRVGMEVVVEFLEGDPDQPLVTGCVYNGRNAVPYPLPEHKTRSTFKTDTHTGEGYNELRFEDKRDQEEIFLHAQKDHNTIIENDESHSIGHDRSKVVGNDQSEDIGRDKRITVGQDHVEYVGRDVIYEVERNQEEVYGKDHLHRVGNILKQDIYADHLEVVGRNYDGTVKGKIKLNVGDAITTNAGNKHTLMAGKVFQIAGPGGKITIDSSGITLEAPNIWLKGNVSMGGTGSAQVPALKLAANDALPICEECLKAAEEDA